MTQTATQAPAEHPGAGADTTWGPRPRTVALPDGTSIVQARDLLPGAYVSVHAGPAETVHEVDHSDPGWVRVKTRTDLYRLCRHEEIVQIEPAPSTWA